MNQQNNQGKTKRIIQFSLVLLSAMVILFILIDILWPRESVATAIKPAPEQKAAFLPNGYQIILEKNKLLADRLKNLQQLDQQYANQLPEPNNQFKLDSINQAIVNQEDAFRGGIDSILLNSLLTTDSNLNKTLTDLADTYRGILDNRFAISSLRTAVALNKNNLPTNDKELLKIQNDLSQKNNRIAALESELKITYANKINTAALPNKDATRAVEELQEYTAVLQNNIAAITRENNKLKMDNEAIIKQQLELQKNIKTNEVAQKNKAAEVQQKLTDLNASLKFAQVDCNLSRVDAAKIISNAKQRKALLSESSGILNSLANSTDADIKKRVKDRIIQLNQVAANSRD